MNPLERAAYAAGFVGGRAIRTTRDAAGRATLAAVDAVLASPVAEEAVTRVFRSALTQKLIDDLVNEVAHSPALTDAIARQSMGFADQVAGGVRARSRRADNWLELKARSALRRRSDGR